MTKKQSSKKKILLRIIKSFFWFLTGAFFGLFFFTSFLFIIFQKHYQNRVFPGVMIDNVDFGGKKPSDIKIYFAQKNSQIGKTEVLFVYPTKTISITAQELNIGYNSSLLAEQALNIGRSDNLLSNISLVLQSYLNEVSLSPSYQFSENKLQESLTPIINEATIEPIDALFQFQNGRVTTFRPSKEGQEVNMEAIKRSLSSKIPHLIKTANTKKIIIDVPLKVLKPKVTTDQANTLGIKELIGSGTSLFQHSIPNRIYNITLAAAKINGILVDPGETFSFGKALGDVSAFTGYKQAYIIQEGKTILGDGGGVCQVSTTLFRAILNAGLPIVERHAHDYRVGYYEQDSPPGFDATVYVPNVDLRFKNDTNNHILIQTEIDPKIQRLTFYLYGEKDNRQVTISKPILTNQTPALPNLYQDDPSLPKGTIKQIDYAAPGATATFTREVAKDGKVIITDTFVSRYRPWQAIYLKGTKE
ncbi:MAG: VanW family protein [Candidatus Levyibacteriota bacterium]|nr:MAG: VanW family protein [Candidatus Levybacteria bacterium]